MAHSVNDPEPVTSDSGVAIVPTCTYEDGPPDLDVLLVPGGRGARGTIVNGSYAIETDPLTRVVTMRLSGFWTTGTVAEFQQALDRELALIGPGEFDAVVDVRDHAVQSQEVAHLLRSNTERIGSRPRRIANILSDMALQRLQARRIASEGNSRDFRCVADALAWLGGPDTPRDG